jgi:hypothetical protein
MLYKTTKQFSRGPEIILDTFREYADAEHFIQAKLSEDIHFKVIATYRIYEFDDLLKEFTQKDARIPGSGSSGQDSASQSGNTQTFNPTPFNMAPQPGGMPHSWVKDTEESGKK